MDAIVIAGGIPQPDEPLYPFTQGLPKALVDICGKPMVQWVLDAVEKAETIDQVVVVGLSPESNLKSTKIKDYAENQGSILLNIRLGVERIQKFNPQARPRGDHIRRYPSHLCPNRSIGWSIRLCSRTSMFITM